MRAPISWLTDYLEELPPVGELASRLTMSGLEVEAVHEPDPRLVEHLVIARIEQVGRHPDADRLSLCVVDAGGGASRQIVCGATNMKGGDFVVLAEPGAVLPGERSIKRARIRGQESQGMLCSAAELGLGDGAADGTGGAGALEGIIILEDAIAAPGTRAAPMLGLDEIVLEISVTPNRGDCLSIRGLAREISALCGVRPRPKLSERPPRPAGTSRFSVHITAPPQACPLYRGLEVSGVPIGKSPAWLRTRLIAAGLRPINNVVDVTNYLLLDRGQPLHAFDASLLAGDTIEVAALDRQTEFETLDGQSRQLIVGDLVIRDARGVIALAGVMGGLRTAVHDGTRALFLESAIFSPRAVRATSRRLGLVSESSIRFERGVDPAGTEDALLEAGAMISELAGGRSEGGLAAGGAGVPAPNPVRVRPKRVAELLGIEIASSEIKRTLSALGAEVAAEGGEVVVRAPSFRHDLGREIDWIEEIARLHGYDAIPAAAPVHVMSEARRSPLRDFEIRMRDRLAALGFTEIVGLSFCSPERNAMFPGLYATPRNVAAQGSGVALRNPLRPEAAEMRRSVLPTLIDAHITNVRSGARVTDLFCTGRTFAASAEREELDVIGGLCWGPRRARHPGDAGPAEFWDLKGAIEKIVALEHHDDALTWKPLSERGDYHPRLGAAIMLGDSVVGYAGCIHPDVADTLKIAHDVYVFEVDTRKVLTYAPPRRGIRPVSRHPASRRDVSLLVPDRLAAGDVVEAINRLEEPLIESVSVFDEYAGEGIPSGTRALAFSLVYRAPDRTLTDDEVAIVHARVIERLCKRIEVRPRFE